MQKAVSSILKSALPAAVQGASLASSARRFGARTLANEEISHLGFATRAIHGDGHNAERSHAPPLYQTSTFIFDSPEHGADAFAGVSDSFIYTRMGNPTVEGFERVCASLEETDEGISFSSGMGAISAVVLALLEKGDHIICADTMYGPTLHLVNDVLPRYGIEGTVVDTSDLNVVNQAIKPNTKLILLETPANPTNKISDIAATVELCKPQNILVAVDNTFSSPYFQKPIPLGADITIHSLTKYVNGHGDVLGGLACCRSELAAPIRTWRKDCSAGLSPFDSLLALRGVRTLALRMERHHTNGIAVAQFLKSHPKVKSVMHPCFDDFPGHDIAMKQMTGFGSTFSFELLSFEAAKELLKNINVMTLCVSLGNVDTLIEHPASMTHASVPPDLMKAQGLTPELVRISVGVEDVEDIIEDLRQALDKL